MEPKITISLSEYNRLVEAEKVLKESQGDVIYLTQNTYGLAKKHYLTITSKDEVIKLLISELKNAREVNSEIHQKYWEAKSELNKKKWYQI